MSSLERVSCIRYVCVYEKILLFGIPCPAFNKANDRIDPNRVNSKRETHTHTHETLDTQFMLSKIWHWHRMAKMAGIIIKVWRRKKKWIVRKTLLLHIFFIHPFFLPFLHVYLFSHLFNCTFAFQMARHHIQW